MGIFPPVYSILIIRQNLKTNEIHQRLLGHYNNVPIVFFREIRLPLQVPPWSHKKVVGGLGWFVYIII